MPSPYDHLNGHDRRSRKQAGSRQAFDIVLAAAVLIVGLIIGAIRGGIGGKANTNSGKPSTSSSQSFSTPRKKSSSASQQTGHQQSPKSTNPSSSARKQQADGNPVADLTGNVKADTVLAHLAVKGRAPKTGYRRTQFGPAWADTDHNGCDTRNDILNRDLTGVTYRPGTHGCIVLTGTLHDPYTGKTISFKRGRRTSEAVQIDHVVALSDAWQTGAQQISPVRREALANDPYNLLAVDGQANQQKSDSDAASWLPPRKTFRCPYVARQIGVKRKYSLWVTPAEKQAMTRVLASCPAQTVPADT